MQQPDPKITRQITPEWDRLIKLVASMRYGELRIVFSDGKLIRAEKLVNSIKLDAPQEEFDDDLKTVLL